MSKVVDNYDEAHLLVSAVRVLEYKKNLPPSVDDVCDLLERSNEWGNLVARRLRDKGIIQITETPFTTKLFVKEHLKIEEIERGKKTTKISEELDKFQQSKGKISSKVEEIQAGLKKKRKDLFAELEEKLTKEKE